MESFDNLTAVSSLSHTVPCQLITIVITCYNHGRFLEASIMSAAAQTHQPTEIVVVDDGSTDGTPDVLTRHPNITTIRQERQGLSAARNTGLRAAHGELIMFLDADDILLPQALELGLAHLSRHPECAFVSGGYQLIDQDGRQLDQVFQPDVRHNHYITLLHGNFIGMHATVLYRREDLLAIGGFDETLRAAEDYDVFLKITRSRPIAQHHEVIALYRRHDANMTRQYNLMLQNVFAALDAQWEHCLGDRERVVAFQYGVRLWQRFYGRLLFQRFLRRQTWTNRYQDMKALYRHAGIQIPLIVTQLGLKAALGWLPEGARNRLRAIWHACGRPQIGRVDFGSLRRTTPISNNFGFDRGQPVDRYYIENFLGHHADDIRGRVLEIGGNAYTVRFSGDRLVRSDVLNVDPGNPVTTIVADLSNADHIPSNSFDCIIITQTLHLIYDMPAAIRTLHRILKPGGVVLATVPGISQIDRDEWGGSWYWSLTRHSASRLFNEVFLSEGVTVTSFGNVLSAASFLYGLASAELKHAELDVQDTCYPVIIAVRAVKTPITPDSLSR